MTRPAWREVCSRCGRSWQIEDRRWRCSCDGLLDLVGPLVDPIPAGPGPEDGADGSERYGAALPPGTLPGPAITPLVGVGDDRWVKADFHHPSGSFKDRGAAAMLGAAARIGVDSVVVDSSGNAGRAAAAYAASARLNCRVYVPAATAPAKTEAMAGYGAHVVRVEGDRAAAGRAALEEVRASGVWYASHVHQPMFHHGVKTLAYELCEQFPGLDRATIVVPAGNGTLVLGLWIGLGELLAVGRLRRRPVMVAVQAAGCAPLLGQAPTGGTVAAGIAISHPPRMTQIRAAVVGSRGIFAAVTDEQIVQSQEDLATRGFVVEPTGAVAWAARPLITAPAIFILTGSG